MSYILDALRKSESERRRGRVPDLGHQVQLIHKPKKKSSLVAVLIGAGLLLNALVLGFLFWPTAKTPPVSGVAEKPEAVAPAPAPVAAPAQTTRPEPPPQEVSPGAVAETIPPASARPEQQRPTIIVPSADRNSASPALAANDSLPGAVPHLVELPVSFQRSVPDLVFNSHIYASEPSSRRVMINGHYLKAGDSFSGIRVERITEEGVVLSKNGRFFRVGTVRDWVSP